MPAPYAHDRFGGDVLKSVSVPARKLLEQENELFYIGLQGPDILFYYHPLKKNEISGIGTRIHHRPGREFFSRALSMIDGEQWVSAGDTSRLKDRSVSVDWQEIKDSVEMKGWNMPEIHKAQKVYLAGCLCHFMLDSACHGFVEEYINANPVTHEELEGEFDRVLILADGKDPQTEVLTARFVPSLRSALLIAPFYEGVDSKALEESLHSFVKYQDILRCPSDIKRKGVLLAMKAAGQYNRLNGLVLRTSENPLCTEGVLELTRLYAEALPKAAAIMESFMKEDLNPESFLSDPAFDITFDGE